MLHSILPCNRHLKKMRDVMVYSHVTKYFSNNINEMKRTQPLLAYTYISMHAKRFVHGVKCDNALSVKDRFDHFNITTLSAILIMHSFIVAELLARMSGKINLDVLA